MQALHRIVLLGHGGGKVFSGASMARIGVGLDPDLADLPELPSFSADEVVPDLPDLQDFEIEVEIEYEPCPDTLRSIESPRAESSRPIEVTIAEPSSRKFAAA